MKYLCALNRLDNVSVCGDDSVYQGSDWEWKKLIESSNRLLLGQSLVWFAKKLSETCLRLAKYYLWCCAFMPLLTLSLGGEVHRMTMGWRFWSFISSTGWADLKLTKIPIVAKGKLVCYMFLFSISFSLVCSLTLIAYRTQKVLKHKWTTNQYKLLASHVEQNSVLARFVKYKTKQLYTLPLKFVELPNQLVASTIESFFAYSIIDILQNFKLKILPEGTRM